MGVSREARAHRVLVLARDVFSGPGNPTGPPAKMAVSGVSGRPTYRILTMILPHTPRATNSNKSRWLVP